MRPTLYTSITNHGFGHAARTLAVLRELSRQAPQIRQIVNTSVPEYFVRSMLGEAEIELRRQTLDVGIRQSDFLTMDLPGTLRELFDLYEKRAPDLVAREVEYIQRENVQLILADLPPLAGDIGAAAGVPVWALGNFGWDFIYAHYEEQQPGFGAIAARITESYQKFERLFRPAFSEGPWFDRAFAQIQEVGLTGSAPAHNETELRRSLQLAPEVGTPEVPLILLSFGGLGLANLPYHRLAEFDGHRRPRRYFLTYDENAPPLPNVQIIDQPELRVVDLLPLCERIISKPGHGTFCEVARVGRPFVCLRRENFPETPFLLEALQKQFVHRIVTLEEFFDFDGDWSFVDGELIAPRAPRVLAMNASEEIARKIAAHLRA